MYNSHKKSVREIDLAFRTCSHSTEMERYIQIERVEVQL